MPPFDWNSSGAQWKVCSPTQLPSLVTLMYVLRSYFIPAELLGDRCTTFDTHDNLLISRDRLMHSGSLVEAPISLKSQ